MQPRRNTRIAPAPSGRVNTPPPQSAGSSRQIVPMNNYPSILQPSQVTSTPQFRTSTIYPISETRDFFTENEVRQNEELTRDALNRALELTQNNLAALDSYSGTSRSNYSAPSREVSGSGGSIRSNHSPFSRSMESSSSQDSLLSNGYSSNSSGSFSNASYSSLGTASTAPLTPSSSGFL